MINFITRLLNLTKVRVNVFLKFLIGLTFGLCDSYFIEPSLKGKAQYNSPSH
jgi:hypothetical protein